MLSALMTVPANASATARASADLPLAVGPPMTRSGGFATCAPIMRTGSITPLAFAQRLADNPPVTEGVITLIAAAPAERRLDGFAAALGAALRALGADLGGTAWLAPDTACDLAFSDLAIDQADAAARRLLAGDFAGLPVDIVAQPAAGRRKLLLVADMESTVIENEMLDELADFLGLREEVAAITRRAMNGELDFAAALEARVRLLKG